MFSINGLTFTPGNNLVTVTRDGVEFGTLVVTNVSWAEVVLPAPTKSGKELRLLWSEMPRDLEGNEALALEIQTALQEHLWAYVNDGSILATVPTESGYAIRHKSASVYRVTNAEGEWVEIDTSAALKDTDAKLIAAGIMHCLTCNPNRMVMLSAGIVDLSLTSVGDERDAEITPFWNALLSHLDNKHEPKSPFEGVFGSMFGGRLETPEPAAGAHRHVLNKVMVGRITSEFTPVENSAGPINAVAKIYLSGRLAIDLAMDRLGVLGLTSFFDDEAGVDTVDIDRSDIREIADYLRVAPAFAVAEVTPDRFDSVTMREIIQSCALKEDTNVDGRFGFNAHQWNMVSGTARSLGAAEGNNSWFRVLLNAFYQERFLTNAELETIVDEQLKLLNAEGQLALPYMEDIKRNIIAVIHSW